MSKKVNIYYAGFVHRVGGAYYHVVNIEKGLKEFGYEVNIITLDKLPVLIKYIPHLLERIINKLNSPFGFLVKQKAVKFFYKLFFKNTSDIEIFEDIYTYWESPKKSVVILHALWSDNLQAFDISEEKRKQLEVEEAKIINNINTDILTVSTPYKEFLNSRLTPIISNDKIGVLELGIDISKFETRNNNNKSIVYVGSLEARKNVKFLLKVFKTLNTSNSYSLTIVGDGPQKNELEKFISDENIKNVKFLGRLNYLEVITELKKHEYYMHTSTKESFSYALLEAKLSGLTTIAYNGLEVPFDFIDIKVKSFDEKEWTESILKFDSKKSNEESKGFKRENYSYQVMTKNTLDYLK